MDGESEERRKAIYTGYYQAIVNIRWMVWRNVSCRFESCPHIFFINSNGGDYRGKER